MSKKKQTKSPEAASPDVDFDHVSFSIVQLPCDQDTPVPSQRIVQTVVLNGQKKVYVTESSYFRGETYQFLSKFIEESYEKNIASQKGVLGPVDGGRYWVRFNQSIVNGEQQDRVSPEKFE